MDLYINSPIRLHNVVLNQLSTGTTLPFNDRYGAMQVLGQLSKEKFDSGTTVP
jgi:hypothetical protein